MFQIKQTSLAVSRFRAQSAGPRDHRLWIQSGDTLYMGVSSKIPGKWEVKFSIPSSTGMTSSPGSLRKERIGFLKSYFRWIVTTYSRFVTWRRYALEALGRAVVKAANIVLSNGVGYFLKLIKEDLRGALLSVESHHSWRVRYLPRLRIRRRVHKLFLYRARRALPKDLTAKSRQKVLKTFFEEVFYNEDDGPLPEKLFVELKRFRSERSGALSVRSTNQFDGRFSDCLSKRFRQKAGGLKQRASRPRVGLKGPKGYLGYKVSLLSSRGNPRYKKKISDRIRKFRAFTRNFTTERRISECSVVPLCEAGGKIRVVTPVSWETNAIGDIVRTSVKLDSHAFCRHEKDYDFVIPYRKNDIIFSGDLTRATDNEFRTCVTTLLKTVSPWLSEQELTLLCTFRYSLGSTAGFVSARGLFMGTTHSFTVLSLMNFICARAAERATGIRQIRFRLTGDDILALWPKSTIEMYHKFCEEVGFKVNFNKELKSTFLGVFCERIYCVMDGALRLSPYQTQSMRSVLHAQKAETIIGYMRPSRTIAICRADLPLGFRRWLLKGVTGTDNLGPYHNIPWEWGGTGLIDHSLNVRSASRIARKVFTYLLNETMRAYPRVVLSSLIGERVGEVELSRLRPVSFSNASQLSRDDVYIPYADAVADKYVESRLKAMQFNEFRDSEIVLRRRGIMTQTTGCLVGCLCERCLRRRGDRVTTVGEVIKTIRQRVSLLYCASRPNHNGAKTWESVVSQKIHRRTLQVCRTFHGVSTGRLLNHTLTPV